MALLNRFMSNTPAVLVFAAVALVAVVISIYREWRNNQRDSVDHYWHP